jgi:hypothetical protein
MLYMRLTLVLIIADIREELKGQDLSFVEIAKLVGERWQVLERSTMYTWQRTKRRRNTRFTSNTSLTSTRNMRNLEQVPSSTGRMTTFLIWCRA